MSRAAAIGADVRLAGYALAGVEVLPASGAAEADRAWERLPVDVGLLVLTPQAREALADRLPERPHLLWVVVP